MSERAEAGTQRLDSQDQSLTKRYFQSFPQPPAAFTSAKPCVGKDTVQTQIFFRFVVPYQRVGNEYCRNAGPPEPLRFFHGRSNTVIESRTLKYPAKRCQVCQHGNCTTIETQGRPEDLPKEGLDLLSVFP